MDNIKFEVKKSNVRANSEFDFHKIQQQNDNMLDCNIEKDEDEITFEFTVGNAVPFDDINKYSKSDKYILLINVYHLFELSKKVDFPMNPANIYIDINMTPKIMMRDVYKKALPDETRFVLAYKALIGTVLNNKYSFDDFYKGGEKLLLKSKSTSPLAESDTPQDIYNKLIDELDKHKETIAKTKIEADRSKYRNLIYFRRVFSLLTLVLVIACAYFGMYVIPEDNAVIKANESYIKQDYINTIESLKTIGNDRLSSNSKYIYAVSYIKTDALSDEQKNNILSSVTIDSNEKILSYWINLSKNDYEGSIDLSKQLGNKEYLLYGYMKQKAYVEKDGNLSGQERETKLKELESNIKDLTENGTKSLDGTINKGE